MNYKEVRLGNYLFTALDDKEARTYPTRYPKGSSDEIVKKARENASQMFHQEFVDEGFLYIGFFQHDDTIDPVTNAKREGDETLVCETVFYMRNYSVHYMGDESKEVQSD